MKTLTDLTAAPHSPGTGAASRPRFPLRSRSARKSIVVVSAALVLGVSASGAHAASSVTVAGNLQSELGCPSDWMPDCSATHLAYESSDGIWQGTFSLPAGSYEYKAAIDNSWLEHYGAGGVRDGANIGLDLPAPSSVKFYFDPTTHWIADNRNEVIATVAGNFQSELGCPSDWMPDCLRSWLQDSDGDGIYEFQTSVLPGGSYEVKVAINENWTENYGAGGEANGSNIAFTVPAPDTAVRFSYDAASHLLTITSPSPPPSGDPTPPPSGDPTPPPSDTAPPADGTTPPADETTPEPTPSEFTRTLAIRYSVNRQRFRGKLASQSPDCISDQKITVFKTKKGKDPKVGSTTTLATGKYSLEEKKAAGRFYARVRQTSVAEGTCFAAESKPIKVDRLGHWARYQRASPPGPYRPRGDDVPGRVGSAFAPEARQ